MFCPQAREEAAALRQKLESMEALLAETRTKLAATKEVIHTKDERLKQVKSSQMHFNHHFCVLCHRLLLKLFHPHHETNRSAQRQNCSRPVSVS